MAKKKNKTPKPPKAAQVWKFSKSQIMLLHDQARIHQAELAPFQTYQALSQQRLLNEFREEFNIPEGVVLGVNIETLQFTEHLKSDNVIPFPTK